MGVIIHTSSQLSSQKSSQKSSPVRSTVPHLCLPITNPLPSLHCTLLKTLSKILQFLQNPYENRSPFRLLYTSLASYLLFSLPAVSGACLVAAGSWLACRLGFPLSSSSRLICPANAPLSLGVRGAVVLDEMTALGEMVGFDDVAPSPCSPWACSSWNCRARLARSASAFDARSALMDFFAK